MKYLPMPLYIAAGFILSIGCSNQPLATKIKNVFSFWRILLDNYKN